MALNFLCANDRINTEEIHPTVDIKVLKHTSNGAARKFIGADNIINIRFKFLSNLYCLAIGRYAKLTHFLAEGVSNFPERFKQIVSKPRRGNALLNKFDATDKPIRYQSRDIVFGIIGGNGIENHGRGTGITKINDAIINRPLIIIGDVFFEMNQGTPDRV